jgi:hypothetical protein
VAFTFDPDKNAKNIAERGLSFERVVELEWDTALIVEDTRSDYGEPRLLVMAFLDGRLHAAAVTPRGEDLRVISFRKANKREVSMAKKTSDRASHPISPGRVLRRKCFRNLSEKKATEELIRRGRGRPPKADKKVNQTLRLDPDVLEHSGRRGAAGRRA